MNQSNQPGTYRSENYGVIFNEIEEMAQVGGWMLDVKSGRTEWTAQVFEIHDLDVTEAMDYDQGVNFYTGISRPMVTKAISDCISKELPFSLKLQLISKKGICKDVYVKGKPEVNNGEVVRIWGAIQDISDSERKLRKYEDEQIRLKKAQSIGNFGFYETDLVKQTWTASERFCEIFGFDESKAPYTVEEFQTIVHPDDYERVMKAFGEALSNQNDFYEEYRCINKVTGKVICVRSTSKVEYDSDGTPIRILGVKYDVTEYRKLFEAQEQTNMELQEKNIQLEQYAYITSHDLKSPLNNLVSLMELLKMELEGKESEDLKTYFSMTDQALDRMKKQISNLLDRAKIGTSRNIKPINLLDPLTEALSDLNSEIESYGAHVDFDELPTINGEHLELRILFQNLISNAIKYCKPDADPVVKISAKDEESHVEIQIEDNGLGIPHEEVRHVFKMFYRSAEVAGIKGTGIGLAHCKKIVELHKGSIWLTSVLDQGTTVRFTLSKKLEPSS